MENEYQQKLSSLGQKHVELEEQLIARNQGLQRKCEQLEAKLKNKEAELIKIKQEMRIIEERKTEEEGILEPEGLKTKEQEKIHIVTVLKKYKRITVHIIFFAVAVVFFMINTFRQKYSLRTKPVPSLLQKAVEEKLAPSEIREETVYFVSGSVELSSEGFSILDRIGRIVREKMSHVKVDIIGYTDNIGHEWFNHGLSEARAKSVVKYLIERENIDPGILNVSGYGEEKPVASNDTFEGRAKNRRVEILIYQ